MFFILYNCKIIQAKTHDSSTEVIAPTKATKDKSKKPATKTGDAKIEEDLRKFVKVEVKAFGGTMFVLTGEQVNNLSLKSIQNDLVASGYGELANVVWTVVPNKAKTEAILVAGVKFHSKG